ncbi:Sugar isomerase [Agrobacterium tumefaciens str. Kerr 14]|uniref:Sugar isomerase n=1 Tax=Agrobacterium tumefaciens str. Kerr 14 TaxID=1183424 RepID=A0A1S7SAS4_AGRTU|nr:SIS domain-containing protein [Agrobacterium tumefaciens]CUX65698.1 Sugar isomerase [Agrobacterium tumefaciens str. Kerr 14]
MATDINELEIVQSLDQTVANLDRAVQVGRDVAANIDRIYLIACGSANRAMQGIQYWTDQVATNIEVRTFFPAEFMAMNPPKLNERTLVLLASKSGTTPETLAAADFVKGKPCKTVVFTQFETSPLASKGDEAFLLGKTEETFLAIFMLMQTLVGAVLEQKEKWPLLPKLVSSLKALPSAVVAAAKQNETRATEDARLYKDDDKIYFVASGPGATSAYVFGVCILMEMLWIHAYPIDAAEFFHGPFEIVTPKTPLVLIIGEDPSRPLMERVKAFSQKHTERLMIYDSRDYAMEGIEPEIRPIVAPYVIQAALKRLSVRLSIWRDQPLSTRRYMWKSEY